MRTLYFISLFLFSTIVSSAQTFTFSLNENKSEEQHSVTVNLSDRRFEGSKLNNNAILFEKAFTDIAVNQQGIVSISFMHNEEPVFSPPNDGKTYICLITPSRMMVSKDVVTNSTYQYLPVSEYEYRQTYDQLVEIVRKMNASQPVKISSSLIKATKKYDVLGDFHEGRAQVEKNGKYGFINTNGEEVISCQYQLAEPFKDGMAKVLRSGKWGFVNKSGQEVVRCEYDDIQLFDSKHWLLSKNGKKGLMSKSGTILTDCRFTDIGPFLNGRAEVKNGNLKGVVNVDGADIIPCMYNLIDDERNGMCLVMRDRLYGYINPEGKMLIPCEYLYLGELSDGCLVAKNRNGKTGLIDIYGRTVIPFQYEDAKDMGEDKVPVKQREKHESFYGFVNRNNETVLKFKYLDAGTFGSGLAPVKMKKGWVYINEKGKTIIKGPFEEACSFHDGLARIKNNGLWGYINTEGRLIIQNIYQKATDFNGGIAFVFNGKKWGGWNNQGKMVTSFVYDKIGELNNGRCKVEIDGLIGEIDKDGKEVVECVYKSIVPYNDKYDLAIVNGQIRLLDKSGKVAFPFYFDDIVSMDNNMAVVKNNGRYSFFFLDTKMMPDGQFETMSEFSEGLSCVSRLDYNMKPFYGFIDKNGKEIIPCSYPVAYPFSEGLAAVTQFGKAGFVTKNNVPIFDFIYEETHPFSDGLARVKYDGKWGYVNKKGYDTFKSEFNMNAPQIIPNENGTITLEDCPKTYPNINIKVADDGDEAWIYYDGELLTHLKGSEEDPWVWGGQTDLDYIHFLDVNYDGYVDIYLGFGESRSFNTLLVWDPTSEQFEELDGESCYIQNIMLFPEEKKVAGFDTCGMAGACTGGTLFRIVGNRVVDVQAFETDVDIDGPDITFTYTIHKGGINSDVLVECHKKSQIPKEWKDKLSLIIDFDDFP